MVNRGEALLRGSMWAIWQRHACHPQRVRSLLGQFVVFRTESASQLHRAFACAHYPAWHRLADLLPLPQAGIKGMPCGGTNVYTSCRIERPKVQLLCCNTHLPLTWPVACS